MIPVLRPTYTEKIKKDILDVLDSGWTGFGAKTIEFEKKFADLVGTKYAIGTNSGTAALDLCLKAYDIKGGELITTPLTFVADAIVGEWADMDITFADIDPVTLCLDPDSVIITPETKVIIAVDSHGRIADFDGLRKKFDGLIIEDAAHACYTPGAGKKGDITIWSFQAVKSMPIYDGGMITTNDEKIAQKIRAMSWLGIEKSTYERAEGKRYSWDYDIQHSGIKAYMTDVQAIIGLGQLERIGELCAKRRAIQSVYNDGFRGIPEIKIPAFSHTVQYYTGQFERRDELSDYLASKNISTSVHFKPLTEMTYYKKYKKNPLPVTDEIWLKLLTLPCHDGLTWEQTEYIIQCVKDFYAGKI